MHIFTLLYDEKEEPFDLLYREEQEEGNVQRINRSISTTPGITLAEKQTLIEQERTRIARDLHDGAVQQIVAALQHLEIVQHHIEHAHYPQARQELQKSTAILQQSLQELRSSVMELLPSPLQQHAFTTALTTLLSEYAANHPHIVFKTNLPALYRVPAQLEITLYRLLQEALTNIHKHAQATQVEIHLISEHDILTLRIHDNGRGLPDPPQSINQANASKERSDNTEQNDRTPGKEAAQAVHLGLQTMRSRVEEQGGTWQIQSQPGCGTTLQAHFQLRSY